MTFAHHVTEFAAAAVGMAVGGAISLLAAHRRKEHLPTRRFFDALLNGAGVGTALDLLYAVCFDVGHLVHVTADCPATVHIGDIHRIELFAGGLALVYVTGANVLESCRTHK